MSALIHTMIGKHHLKLDMLGNFFEQSVTKMLDHYTAGGGALGGAAGADAAALPLRLTGENADMLQDGGSAQVVCWLVPTGGKNHETSGADRPI